MEYKDDFFFTKSFLRMFQEALEESGADTEEGKPLIRLSKESEPATLSEMFRSLSGFCKASAKPVVMMIDEV